MSPIVGTAHMFLLFESPRILQQEGFGTKVKIGFKLSMMELLILNFKLSMMELLTRLRLAFGRLGFRIL